MSRISSAEAALKAYAHKGNLSANLEAGLDTESDRAATIIITSLLERSLELHLGGLMQFADGPFREEEIFGMEKPIGSFSAKIKLAYALKVIEIETAKQLEILRVARNQCAHSQNPITFDTPEFQNYCRRLFAPDLDPLIPTQGERSFRNWFLAEAGRIGVAINVGSRAKARKYMNIKRVLGALEKANEADASEGPTGENCA